MGDATSISWTDATWNPVRGCSRVSEGCRNCYAERVAARFSDEGMTYHGLARRVLKMEGASQPRWTGEVRFVNEHLADPLRWAKPRRIFVNSMSDLFHEKLTNEQIAAVFGVMAAAPRHTFQVLTKRAKRMREWFAWVESQAGCSSGLLAFVLGAAVNELPSVPKASSGEKHGPQGTSWPLPNVWLGVSVENQDAADERIPELLDTPAAVRFLSCEPLLAPVDLAGIGGGSDFLGDKHDDAEGEVGIGWVIAGCESGPGARPCDVAWLRSLRDQCAAADVPFFLKQAHESAIRDKHGIREDSGSVRAKLPGKPAAKVKGSGVIEQPYLDGVQHAAFPEVTCAR